MPFHMHTNWLALPVSGYAYDFIANATACVIGHICNVYHWLDAIPWLHRHEFVHAPGDITFLSIRITM